MTRIQIFQLSSEKLKHFRIDTDLLIPGRGQPIKNATVIVKENVIDHVCKTIELPHNLQDLPSLHVPVLMPGMWDCHVHYVGSTLFSIENHLSIPPALAGARSVADCARTLNAGFTSVRELAGYGIQLAKAIDEGSIKGPNIYSAGSALSQTGGHGDVPSWRLNWLNQLGHEGAPIVLADGVEGCRKAVREQIRKGAKVIKVFASGGVLSENDNPHYQQFSDAELEAIVDEAGRMGRVVAAHVHGKAGGMAVLRAGGKTIEHGTYMDEEAFALMKEKDAIFVCTSFVASEGVNHPEMFSPEGYKKLLQIVETHRKACRLAIKMGVRMAIGTDLGVSIASHPLSHGHNGHELSAAVRNGMTTLQAIEAATANGPETLGLEMAPKSGIVREGYDADLIALSGNPLDNIEILADPDNITHVWKGGKCEKSRHHSVSLY